MAPRLSRRDLIVAAAGTTVAAACSHDETGSTPRVTTTARFPAVERPADGRVPAPSSLVRTTWSSDRFSLGSYSAMPPLATPADRATVRRPLGDRVFFAGEHTNTQYPSTVHGALASGRRAADEVLAAASGHQRVIVIGAGAAGLECAAALRRAGVDVTVLEGRPDRVGGRLWSPRPDGWSQPIDLGASWVHDTGASDVDRRLVAAGVRTVAWDWDDVADWHAGSGVRSNGEAVGALSGPVEAVVDAADDRGDDGTSLAAAIIEDPVLARVDPAVRETYLQVEVAAEYGLDADELSARWALQEGSEGPDVLVAGGYAGLLGPLADGLDIRLGHEVTGIDWGPGGVEVTHTHGTTKADRAVVTVPLGVLRSDAIVFDPPLEEDQRAALARLRMGLLDKVFLRWDRRWWTEPASVWTLTGEPATPYVLWINLAPVTGDAVLLALVGGRQARAWAARRDDEVRAAALVALQRFLDAGW